MRYLVIFLIVFYLAGSPADAFAEKKPPTLEEVGSLIESKKQAIDELKFQLEELGRSRNVQASEKVTVTAEVRKLESQLAKLQMHSVDRESFDVKNEIIGINYEIRSNKKKLDELNELYIRSENAQKKYNSQLVLLEEEIKILELRKSVLIQKKASREAAKNNSAVQQAMQKRIKEQERAEKLQQEKILAVKRKASANLVAVPGEISLSQKTKVAKSAGEPAGKNWDIEQEQARLLNEARSMRPAAAALNRAKAKALVPLSHPPVLGEQVDFLGANPPGTNPQSLGAMTHLGNNQYMIQVHVEKGKNEFIVGEFHFFKLIPNQYDGAACLILLDLQNQQQPNFQIFVVD